MAATKKSQAHEVLNMESKQKPPRVAILVLNFNGKQLLRECLDSLRKTSYGNFEVLVVDNGSTDGSQSYLKESFPWAKLIALDQNYGFCGGYNIASRLVKSEFLLFINNDIATADSGWLDHMVETILSLPNIAVVGAKQLIASKKDTIENVGGSFFRWQGGSRIGFGELDKHQYDDVEVEPFYISGAALLIRRELFLQCGGFDPKMFAYGEDLDLCWRLRIMGFQMRSSPKSVLLHKSSASFKKSLKSLYLSNRNLIRASIKNYSIANLLRTLPFLLSITVAFGFGASVSSKKTYFLLSITKSLWFNLKNFPSSINSRQLMQAQRKVNDKEVFEKTYSGNLENLSTISNKLKVFR
jgi:GT2 family glycosyltransferase